MIPKEVGEIASLIDANWTQGDDLNMQYVLEAAWRIYNAGFRRKEIV